jgi:IPT/TIG domain
MLPMLAALALISGGSLSLQLSDSSAAAATGILPPNNPSANVAQDDTPPPPNCSGTYATVCEEVDLHQVNFARKQEGVAPMVLPNGFSQMPVAEQIWVVSNLERKGRGASVFQSTDVSLNAYAQTGAVNNDDPSFPGNISSGGSIWAGGYSDALEADYGWMYDDGPGGQNLDCTASDSSGCWGHRDNILTNYGSNDATGTGYEAGGDDTTSYAQLFVGGYTSTSTSLYSWSTLTFPKTPAPEVVGISPAQGPGNNGPAVTIFGNYFTGVSAVDFGGVAATNLALNWDGSITASPPPNPQPGQADVVDVTVTTSGAASATTPVDHYTYAACPSCGGGQGGGGGTGPPIGSLAAPVVGMASTPSGQGYWLTNSAGAVSIHGDAVNYGSMAGQALDAPISHIVSTPSGDGYWLVAADGGTFAFGDAGFFGSMGGQPLNAPVVDLAPTKSGKGYWLVATDGGIFAFGDAAFHGSMGGKPLNRPIVGIAPDNATGGYWEVATDGGIFAFGAPFYGSTGNIHLNKPVNGMATSNDDGGYWFVASDGGIFAYGDAGYFGSTGGTSLNAPIMGMAADPSTGGYWLVASDGGIFAYHAGFFGAD